MSRFPDSADLAVAHGRALRLGGQEEQGLKEEARAGGLLSYGQMRPHGQAPGETALAAQLAAHVLAALAEPAA